MLWFRSNRGGIAWLAVFALACQFCLSFGHIHLKHYGGDPSVWTLANGTTDPAIAWPSSPQRHTSDVADGLCAICANVSLANALVMPGSPIILVPKSFGRTSPWSYATAPPYLFDRLPLGARGPPRA